MLELKRVFSKQVEKVAERTLGKSVAQELQREQTGRIQPAPRQPVPYIHHRRFRQLAWTLRTVLGMSRTDHGLMSFGYEFGLAMRAVGTLARSFQDRAVERARAVEREAPSIGDRKLRHRPMAEAGPEVGMEIGD